MRFFRIFAHPIGTIDFSYGCSTKVFFLSSKTPHQDSYASRHAKYSDTVVSL